MNRLKDPLLLVLLALLALTVSAFFLGVLPYPFGILILLVFCCIYPQFAGRYGTDVAINVLIYICLGLGLNVVVGLAGMLDLGYIAFYAVGAYSYSLLNLHFGISFWLSLPIGMVIGAIFGCIIGYPTLRMRGDYLAIVTLGFGEIIRLVLENWNDFSFGPSGIANIPRPSFFGIEMSLEANTISIYFLMIALVLFTILVVRRLQHSRIGRAWIALREDVRCGDASVCLEQIKHAVVVQIGKADAKAGERP